MRARNGQAIMSKDVSMKIKIKGGWCKPPLLIDPPKPDPVEVGFRPPREANLYKLAGKRAFVVPGM